MTILNRSSKFCVVLMLVTAFFNVNEIYANDNKPDEDKRLSSILRKQVFKGTISEVVKQSLTTYVKYPDGFVAYVTWIIPPGSFVTGPIYDKNGNTTRKGDLLVQCDSRYYKARVEAAEGNFYAAKGSLKSTKANFQRCKKLFNNKSISEREKDKAEAEYFKAIGVYKKSNADLDLSKYDLEFCDLRARSDGYVGQVFARPGNWSNVDYPVLKLTKLNPINVDIKMDRKIAKEIVNQQAGVSIKPLNSDKSVGVYNTMAVLTETGVTIPADNFFLATAITNVSVVHPGDLMCALYFYPGSKGKEIGVPWECVIKDDKGYYVWQAVGQEECLPGKVIDKIFKVKKLYVNLGNEVRDSIFGPIRILTSNKSLKNNDILVMKPPKNLKDGQKIACRRRKCAFWPDDEVEVTVTAPE